MKVLHVISSLSIGGAELTLFNLLSRMDRQRFTNLVVCLTATGPVGERIKALGISVVSLGMPRGKPSAVSLYRLIQLLRQERPAVVQTWLYHADLLGTLAALFARSGKLAWNIRASNMDMSKYRRLSHWTVRACARLSGMPRTIVVNSQAGRDYHTQIGYHPRIWTLIPNGIDVERFHPDATARASVRAELDLAADSLLIGLFARYDAMKDHATFLRAAGLLARQDPKVHFLLAGEGIDASNSELIRRIADEQIENRMQLLGARSDVPRLMAALDVAASSSLSEGFPNSVAEAMACGVACVVTDVGDSAQIVADTGFTVPPADPQALAAGWRTLLAGGATMLHQQGQAARRRVCQQYSLDTMVARYQQLYATLDAESASVYEGQA